MNYLILVSTIANGLGIAEELGLLKKTNRIIKEYRDSDDYAPVETVYQDLIIIALYFPSFCNGGKYTIDTVYQELWDGSVSKITVGSKQESFGTELKVKFPYTTLSSWAFNNSEKPYFDLNKAQKGISKYYAGMYVFLERLKTLQPIHELINDISEDLLKCNYNEVRELWRNDKLNALLQSSLGNKFECERADRLIDKYKIRNTKFQSRDLQYHVSQAVFLAGGWPDGLSSEYSQLDHLSVKEKVLVEQWLATRDALVITMNNTSLTPFDWAIKGELVS